MDLPFPLIVLLALPLVAAGLILVVAVGRRRGRRRGADAQPVHRLQADSATVQDAVVHPPAAPPAGISGRARRAASARPPKDD